MKTVNVQDQSVNVNSGQVRLTRAQAAVRMHALKIVGKADRDGAAVYDVTGPLCFKRGESFGFSGETAKNGQLRDIEAEALAKLEAEDRIRAEVRAEYEKSLARVREEFQESLRVALVDQEAKLRAELSRQ